MGAAKSVGGAAGNVYGQYLGVGSGLGTIGALSGQGYGAAGNQLGGAFSSLGQGDTQGFMNGLSGSNAANGAFGAGGIKTAEMPNVQQGTNVTDVANAQKGAANSLQSQQALLQALQGQNGLGQQNAIAGQQQGLANQLQQANGLQTQQGAIQGLQGAAGQYQNIANGTGPNPAQAMLNQQTGQNVANQAALMAGQRGAGSNVGLMARQAGQQGAATQQQAVGQGATMEAQQRIAGLQGLTGAEQAVGGLGGQQLAAQQAQQQAMANQANIVAGQQIGANTANVQANLANQQAMQGALQGINTSNVAGQGSVNAANAALGQQQLKGQQQVAGGIMGGIGSMLGSLAEGGEVKKMADGGDPGDDGVPQQLPALSLPTVGAQPAPAAVQPVGAAAAGPQSSFGKFLSGFGSAVAPSVKSDSEDDSKIPTGDDAAEKGSSKLVGGLLTAAMMASKGGLASSGGHVKAKKPSQKPVKHGDDESNDKIPAMLSEKEIVLPRSVTLSNDPVGNSAKFVAQVLAKRKHGK